MNIPAETAFAIFAISVAIVVAILLFARRRGMIAIMICSLAATIVALVGFQIAISTIASSGSQIFSI